MSKTFDSINHDILLQKLHSSGVSNHSLGWFKSYPSDRYQRARIQDVVFDLHAIRFGVPQGSILGPVLFTIYVNDLLSVPVYSKSACYVDDCKLYLSFPSLDVDDAIRNLNKDSKSISRWCCQNSLLINPDKTKLLQVGVPQFGLPTSICINTTFWKTN